MKRPKREEFEDELDFDVAHEKWADGAELKIKDLKDTIEMCRDELIECGFMPSGTVMKRIKQELK